jgi:integrase/recombinase XerC
MTVFALPAAVLDAIFALEAAPELEHQATVTDVTVPERVVGLDDEGILELYARDQRARGLAPHTLRNYRASFAAFTRALHAGGLTLLTVQRDDIAGWIAGRGKVNRTRAIYATRLHLLFRWMLEEGHRADLPTKGLPRQKVPRSLPRPIPTEGLHHALEAADPRVGLMLSLAAFAGLRRAEISKIDRADILDDRTPPLLLIFGKGSRERLVPIGPVLAEAFDRFGLPDSGPLFLNRSGGQLAPHSVGLLISGHLRACGVDCTAHQGRHTFGTQLYGASGADLLVVQQMLGHASPVSTAIYAAWSPARAASAIALL